MAKRLLSFNCKKCSDRVQCMIKPGRTMFIWGAYVQVPCSVLKPLVVKIVHVVAEKYISKPRVGRRAQDIFQDNDTTTALLELLNVDALIQLRKTQHPENKTPPDAEAVVHLKKYLLYQLYSIYDVYTRALKRSKYLEKKAQVRLEIWSRWLNDELQKP